MAFPCDSCPCSDFTQDPSDNTSTTCQSQVIGTQSGYCWHDAINNHDMKDPSDPG